MTAESMLFENGVAGAAPKLSVLIPYYRDDPTRLIACLDRNGGDVEMVVLDDGSRDDALSHRILAALGRVSLPGRLIRLGQNEGRAAGRNRLGAADKQYILDVGTPSQNVGVDMPLVSDLTD